MNKDKAVIDGSSIAYLEAPKQPRANIKNIFAVMRAVEAAGFEPIVIIDPSVRSILSDANELQCLLEEPCAVPVPPDSDTPRMVLETAEKHNAIVVSNNAYVEYLEQYPWIELRRTPVALIDGAVHLLDFRLRRAG